MKKNKTIVTAVKNFIDKGYLKKATLVLDRLHSVDAAEVIETLNEEQKKLIFTKWSPKSSAEALIEMDEHDQVDIAEHLAPEIIANILKDMPADDATDLLGDLESGISEKIISLMKPKSATHVKQLLKYGKNTAGGIMTPDFISLRKRKTAEQALNKLRKEAKKTEAIYNLFVVNDERQLVGALSLRDLITAAPDTLIKEIMSPDMLFVQTQTDQEEVAQMMSKYDLLVLPVVDEEKHLKGVITIDDVVDVIEDEATEDMYRMSGASEFKSDVAETSLLSATKSRIPWLILALLGEVIFVGAVAAKFSFLYEAVPALGIYWAAMTSIGGNTSFQAATVAVRGLATGQIDPSIIRRRVGREFLLGISISFITTIIIFIYALMINNMAIAIVVGVANVAIILAGALTGAVVPVVFHKMGIDPAVSSSPLLAFVMDGISLLIYFSIAFSVLTATGVL